MSNPLPAKSCADIAPSEVQWLWKPYLARGRLAILDGEPNTGKSLVAIDLAARLSRGGPLPDGSLLAKPGTALILNAEDDLADTLRPRAAAAGADLSRVIVADFAASGPPQFPKCVEQLFDLICDRGADLLVIDPLSAFLPRGIRSDSDVRRALAPLAGLAAETGCAVLIVRHLARSVGPNAVYRSTGSMGALGAALTGLLLARHPEEPDLRVLAVTKSYLGAPPAALGVRLASTDTGPSLHWTGAVDLSADELCVSRSADAVRRPRERAAEFLRAALAGGPRPVAELEALAAERGLSWTTLKRAKEQLKLKSELVQVSEKEQAWRWFDPTQIAAKRKEELAELDQLRQLGKELRMRRREARDG